MNLETISIEELKKLFQKSRESPRKRAIKMFHDDSYEGPQVCLNVIQPGSYIQPHFRYQDESIIHYIGDVCSLWLDNKGNVINILPITKKNPYIFLPKKTFHTIIALEPDSALWMVVQGPHNPKNFSEFLSGTPTEKEDYGEYFANLKSVARDCFLNIAYPFPHALPK